jgi:hypothetical protein
MPSNIVKRFAGSTLSLSMDLTTFMPTSDKWEAWKFASMIKYVQGVDCLACTPLYRLSTLSKGEPSVLLYRQQQENQLAPD